MIVSQATFFRIRFVQNQKTQPETGKTMADEIFGGANRLRWLRLLQISPLETPEGPIIVLLERCADIGLDPSRQAKVIGNPALLLVVLHLLHHG